MEARETRSSADGTPAGELVGTTSQQREERHDRMAEARHGEKKQKERKDKERVSNASEGRERNKEKMQRRKWRQELRQKEKDYWDSMYDRGRRMVLGSGLPCDPRRGIRLLRRAAREADHLPAQWDLQSLMELQNHIDITHPSRTYGRPVGFKRTKSGEYEGDHDSEGMNITGSDGEDRSEEEAEKEREEEERRESEARNEEQIDELGETRTETTNFSGADSSTMVKDHARSSAHSTLAQVLGRVENTDHASFPSNLSDGESEQGDDDWEYESEDEELTEAEFREVIDAIQRVRLTALQRLGQLRATNSDPASSTSSSIRPHYEMDWTKAVRYYRRYVTCLPESNSAASESPVMRRKSSDVGPASWLRRSYEGLRSAAREISRKAQADLSSDTLISVSEPSVSSGSIKPKHKTKKIDPRWERIACYNLGLCYYNGQGIAQDTAIAAQLFTRSAELGYVNGINSLGLCYYRGQGIETNIDKALELFRQAAEQGYVIAQYNLANCLGTGANGIYEKNLLAGACLYVRSACQGDVAAFAHLVRITKNKNCFGNKETEYVVPTLFNQCLKVCWEAGLFGRHPWECIHERTSDSESDVERYSDPEEKSTSSTVESEETSLAVSETDRSTDTDNGSEAVQKPKAEKKKEREHRKKSDRTKANVRSRKKQEKNIRSNWKSFEAEERAQEQRQRVLPQEIINRMHERRNTCVRPECEHQFWGKGRVVWKFPLYLPTQTSKSAQASSTSAPDPPDAAEPASATTSALLSTLSPVAPPPGFGTIEEMLNRYLLKFEEETEVPADDQESSPDVATDADVPVTHPAADPSLSSSAANPSAVPSETEVWSLPLILPFCSVHCSELSLAAVGK